MEGLGRQQQQHAVYPCSTMGQLLKASELSLFNISLHAYIYTIHLQIISDENSTTILVVWTFICYLRHNQVCWSLCFLKTEELTTLSLPRFGLYRCYYCKKTSMLADITIISIYDRHPVVCCVGIISR